MNNQNVEDFNSITARIGSTYCEPTFENLYRDSLMVEVSRVVKAEQREELNLASVSSSKGKGEIWRQENLHLTSDRFHNDFPRIKDWMLKRFQKISDKTEILMKEEPDLFSTDTFDLSSISNSMIVGTDILLTGDSLSSSDGGYVDRYNAYLENDKIQQAKMKAQSEKVQAFKEDPDFHVYDFIQVPFLHGFLNYMNPISKYLSYKAQDGKEKWIVQIMENYNINLFLKYCSDNHLHNNAHASKYLEDFKLNKKKGIVKKKDPAIDEEEFIAEIVELAVIIPDADPSQIEPQESPQYHEKVNLVRNNKRVTRSSMTSISPTKTSSNKKKVK